MCGMAVVTSLVARCYPLTIFFGPSSGPSSGPSGPSGGPSGPSNLPVFQVDHGHDYVRADCP